MPWQPSPATVLPSSHSSIPPWLLMPSPQPGGTGNVPPVPVVDDPPLLTPTNQTAAPPAPLRAPPPLLPPTTKPPRPLTTDPPRPGPVPPPPPVPVRCVGCT